MQHRHWPLDLQALSDSDMHIRTSFLPLSGLCHACLSRSSAFRLAAWQQHVQLQGTSTCTDEKKHASYEPMSSNSLAWSAHEVLLLLFPWTVSISCKSL